MNEPWAARVRGVVGTTIRGISIDLRASITWMAISAAIGQAATLVAGALVANAVGTRGFGTYGFLQSTLINWSTIATLSSGLLATRYIAAYARSDTRRAGQVLGYCAVATAVAGSVAGVALFASRTFLTQGIDDAHSVLAGLSIVALVLPFSSLTLFQTGALVGLERFRLQAVLSSVQAVVFVVGPFLGAVAYGPIGAVAGLAIAYVLRFATHGVALLRAAGARGIRVTLGDARAIRPLFMRFALPASLTGLTTNAGIWVGSLLLIAQTGGPHHMGLFAAALNFRLLVLFLPVQISTISVPLLTRHLTGGEHAQFKSVLRAATLGTAVAAGGLALVLALLAPLLLRLFGPGFSEAENLTRLLLLGAVVEAVSGAMYQALPSREQMWRSLLFVALPRDGMFVVAALLLVPRFQSIGLGIAFLISQCVGLAGVLAARRYRASW